MTNSISIYVVLNFISVHLIFASSCSCIKIYSLDIHMKSAFISFSQVMQSWEIFSEIQMVSESS